MRILHYLHEIDASCRGGGLTIGNFDGVHRGHAELVTHVRARASAANGPAIVLTFDPHPARILRPLEAPPPLTWPERKAELLGELGIDVLIAYPTTQDLLRLMPEDFFRTVIVDQLRAQALVEGPNFYFGCDRRGDISLLGQLCDQYGVSLTIVPPCLDGGQIISSSRIRAAIRQGNVQDAACLLTYPYRIRGLVTHGARRGMNLGFPTANLEAIDTLVPGLGVYAGRAIVRGTCCRAAIHIGPNPTFGEQVHKVEVHLLDFCDSIYGEILEVQFERRLRDIHAFSTAEELRVQLALDIQSARGTGEGTADPRLSNPPVRNGGGI